MKLQINGLFAVDLIQFKIVLLEVTFSFVTLVVIHDLLSPDNGHDPSDATDWSENSVELGKTVGGPVASLSIAAGSEGGAHVHIHDVHVHNGLGHAVGDGDHGASAEHVWHGFLCWSLDDDGGSGDLWDLGWLLHFV